MFSNLFSFLVSKDFWEILGGTASALLAVGLLFKYLFDIRMERHLEKFRKDIQIDLIEHETKFSHVYVKRTEVMTTVWENFIKCENAGRKVTLGTITDGEPQLNDPEDFLGTTLRARAYFETNKIWLPHQLVSGFEPLIKIFTEIHNMGVIPPLTDYLLPDGTPDAKEYAKATLARYGAMLSDVRIKAENLIFDFLEHKR